ncbi:hypothetical protein Sste5346_006542 [Sporothrix stenoceras]|uniref:E3 ubiquitin-protein ligase listerin n=1 Tax=Sporothrix stenoceras TaxID=5173 RepID=A0ABR3YY99_9PEZI
MSRPQRPRGPPPAGLKGFGSMSPAAKPGASSFGKGKATGGGGFGGFETTRSKSGLAYVAERSDLSAISDAHVVVSFKNLVKKDSTTKARALEDLLSHAQAHPYTNGGGVEDAVLEAWVQCYPRLSIDDARRVRELSHSLQLDLMQSARKRMERHIPKVASAWLAGTYDRDRAVAKAASDGLASFLTTDEKTTMFWKRLQPQILEDATAAIQETAATLSDMRSTTQDDADLKYYRVLYSSLSLVLALLRKLSVADTESLHHAYTQFFAVEAVWSSAALSSDSHVRRVTYELLLTCLETRPSLLEAQLPRLTKLLTQEAPKTIQSGSVIDYVKVLQKLTKDHPETWADGGHPFTRLRPLVEKGSQGTAASPAAPSHNFWTQLDALFSLIPAREIASEAASSVLASFRKGLSSRDEPQSNAIDGWTAYLSMVRRLVDVVTPQDSRVALVETNVYSLFNRFLGAPTGNTSTVWATGAHVPILTRASLLIARPAYADIVVSARTEWERLASNFSGRMANSLPEVSKEFKASQQEIANEGDRWFGLVADIHRSVQQVESQQTATEGASANLVEDVLEKPTLSLLQSAVDLLKKRNFKPFGAAQLVSAVFTHAPHLLQNNSTGETIIESLFPTDDTEQLSLVVASPSAPALLSCLRSMASIPAFHDKYTAIYASIVSLLLENKDEDPEATAKSIALLISDASDVVLATSRRNNDLQEYLGGACYATAQGQLSSWDLFHAVASSNALSTPAGKKLASGLVRSLGSSNANSAGVLTALETIATQTPELLADDEELHLELVAKLLGMMEIRDTTLSAKVHALRALIDGSSSRAGGNTKSSLPARLIKIVQDNLDSARPNSLEIDTLVEQAVSIATSSDATDEDKENLFPNTNIWMQTMQAFFQSSATCLNPSLALTSNVGGAYLLVPSNKPTRTQRPAVSRDRHGSSIPARMAAYTTQLLTTVVEADSVSITALPQEFQVELLYLLYLVAELGSDQVAVSDAHSLWGNLSDPFMLAVAEDSIAAIRSNVAGVLLAARNSPSVSSLADALVAIMLQQTQQPTALAVYTTRALSGLLQIRMEGRTFSATADEEYLVKQNLWKSGAGTTLGALAFLTGYGEVLAASKSVSNFCNRLISDIAGANPKASPAKSQSTLDTLVLLNACMAVYEVGALPTASNRLMFAVKQITSWFGKEDEDDEDDDGEKEELDTRIAAEGCRALQRLLPCIKDMYGPHWERSIKFSISLWERAAIIASKPSSSLDEHLPYVYASLKLIGALEAIDEPNDDLEDALALFSEAKWTGMRRLLLALAHRSPSIATSSRTQPQSVVDTLLSRMASKTPLTLLTADTSDLYTLVASDSRDIQAAGYGFLHRALPAQQEELSFNIILEKKEAKLPDELLSLLLGAPTLEAYPDDVLATFPTPVRGYLLAWRLVFDAFSTASAKVRSDYATHLASSGHITALLDFTFDVLGHSAAHPLNLEREGLADSASIIQYDLKTAEASLSDEKHMHQLLVHLYYLTLKYVPGLFKAWYTACRTKQTTVAVEAWTAKYISALVIEEVLDEVAEWGNTQGADGAAGASASGDDDHEMIIKTNKRAREVVAGYEVDELMLSIALRLPANYPIDNVAVVGLNRVAVDEKKWQSWLMITQGVIAFANGSLVEGLAAFQRNVLGALKGHTECAICYSIISVEKRVPEKRCGTCKNMFHRSCLYKWFLSSNQNSCPLCRNPISFLGAEKFKRRDVEY